MEDDDLLDEYIDKLVNDEYVKLSQGDIGLSTCQLFKHDSVTTTPFASGVFVFVQDNFYLLTASHVIEDWSDSNRLFVPIEEGFISIAGKGFGTKFDSDKLDVAYIKLKPELIPKLIHYYRFIPEQKILHHEKVLSEPSFCVFGYPARNKRKETGKKVEL